MHKLLVVDDEPNVLYSLKKSLQSPSLEVATARSAMEGLDLVHEHDFDVVILDVRLPDMSGLDVLERIREAAPQVPIIIITAFASTATAIEAMKRGALEYLLKPVNLPELRQAVAKALAAAEFRSTETSDNEVQLAGELADQLVGRSPAMQSVYKAIGRVAPLNVTALILGESGTGKELVARAIHQYSRRSDGPFLAINCAAIPESLLESELFGHEKGAFTGADRRRMGRFEQVDRGTIFLDEIGDMSTSTQAKVLRLLQDQQFERVGGKETVCTDVRIIAATNQDLEERVAKGLFRQDLFYRLKVFTIDLPPLRHRDGDVALLTEHFLRLLNKELGRDVRRIEPGAQALLDAHPWPGNVRELQNVVKYALVNASSDVVTTDCLPASVRRGNVGVSIRSGESSPRNDHLEERIRDMLRARPNDLYTHICRELDRFVLTEVLREVQGNIVQASRVLDISRNTLKAKLRTLGLSIEKQLQSGADQSGQTLTHD